jgi:hypothetical protein
MSGGSSLLGGSASNSAADAMFGIATPGPGLSAPI